MENEDVLVLDVDFGDNTPALGSGLSFLSAGPHTSKVERFNLMKDRSERRVLYVYMVTPEGEHHRQKFWPDQGPMFLAGFLVSAGIAAASLLGKKRIPLAKVVGRTVYFDYKPPEFDASGRPIEGTYSDYTWYTKDQWSNLFGTKVTAQAGQAVAPRGGTDFSDLDETPPEPKPEPKVEAKPAPKPQPKPEPKPEPPPTPPGDDDFSFLNEDDNAF